MDVQISDVQISNKINRFCSRFGEVNIVNIC